MKCVAKICLPNGAKHFFIVVLVFALVQEILGLYGLQLRVVSTKEKISLDFWENPLDFDKNEDSQEISEDQSLGTVPAKIFNSTQKIETTPNERAIYLQKICIEKYDENTFDDVENNCRKYNGYDSFMINPHLMLR